MLRRRCDNPPRLGSQSRRHVLTHAQCCAPLAPCPCARTGLSPTRAVTSPTQSAVAHSRSHLAHAKCCRPLAPSPRARTVLSPTRSVTSSRPSRRVWGWFRARCRLPTTCYRRTSAVKGARLVCHGLGSCSCGSVVLTCTQCHQRSNRPSVCFVQWICSTISPRLFFPLRAHLRTHSAVVHPLCHLHAHAWRCRPLAPSPPRARTV